MTDQREPPSSGESGPAGSFDQQWFDRLAGRANDLDARDPAAAAEVDLLRKAFARMQARDEADDRARAQFDERQRLSMIETARKQGLLRPSAPATSVLRAWLTSVTEKLSRHRGIVLVGASAVLALAVLVPRLDLFESPAYGPPTQMRGEGRVQHVSDDQPKRRAEAMASRLRTAGLTSRIYQAGPVFYLDVEVLPEQFESARAVLIELGIEPRPGLVRVQIMKP